MPQLEPVNIGSPSGLNRPAMHELNDFCLRTREILDRMSQEEFEAILSQAPPNGAADGRSKAVYEASYFLNRLFVMAKEYEEKQTALQRDSAVEIKGIIESYLNSQYGPYRLELEQLRTQIGSMRPECRLTVCMPVAAHEEHRHIYRTLRNFQRQSLASEEYEVVLLNNHPTSPGADSSGIYRTFKEIERFRKNHPGFNLRVAYGSFQAYDCSLGHIRKVVTDLTALRYYTRGAFEGDHIILRADADTCDLPRDYVRNYLKRFDADRRYEAFGGPITYPAEVLQKNDLLYVLSSFCNVLDAGIRKYRGASTQYYGVNAAFRLSAYCAIGGYNPKMLIGEDLNLDKRLIVFRKDSKEYKAFGYAKSKARLVTSSRRAEFAVSKGYSPIEQWSLEDYSFSENNPEVRCTNSSAYIRQSPAEFVEDLNYLLNRTIKAYYRFFKIDLNHEAYNRAFDSCGIEWEKTGRLSCRILWAKRMFDKIKEFKENGLKRQTNKMMHRA